MYMCHVSQGDDVRALYDYKYYSCESYFYTPCRGSEWLRNVALHASYFGPVIVQPRKFRGDFRAEVRKHPLLVDGIESC